jgi:hypothetical protein
MHILNICLSPKAEMKDNVTNCDTLINQIACAKWYFHFLLLRLFHC